MSNLNDRYLNTLLITYHFFIYLRVGLLYHKIHVPKQEFCHFNKFYLKKYGFGNNVCYSILMKPMDSCSVSMYYRENIIVYIIYVGLF